MSCACPDLPFTYYRTRRVAWQSERELRQKQERTACENHALIRTAPRAHASEVCKQSGVDEVPLELRMHCRIGEALMQQARVHIADDGQRLRQVEREQLLAQVSRQVCKRGLGITNRVVGHQARPVTRFLCPCGERNSAREPQS